MIWVISENFKEIVCMLLSFHCDVRMCYYYSLLLCWLNRSDTVPAYVAAHLESAPRDPLAAEESSRKASGRVNEAAPPKVNFKINSKK